jgi:hypothetical protein
MEKKGNQVGLKIGQFQCDFEIWNQDCIYPDYQTNHKKNES